MENEPESDKTAEGGEKDAENISMLDACLLHSRADRSLRTVMSSRLDKFNLTMMEWLLIGAVKSSEQGGITMSGAAGILDVTLPQVTALSASLTKSKLIKQKVNRQDRRSRRLTLTAAGERLMEEIDESANEAFEEWSKGIDKEQLDTYMETVKILANRDKNKES